MASAKAISMSRKLCDDLRADGFTVTESFDASGYPILAVGTITIGGQGVYIRVKEEDSLNVTVLGAAETVFAQHVIQIAMETSAVANVSLVLESNKSLIFAEATKQGSKVEFYLETNGTAPSATTIAAAKLKQTWFGNSIQYKVMSQS